MKTDDRWSRRGFLSSAAAALAFGRSAPGQSRGATTPVGLELYSVREELQKDLMGTVGKVAEMGYQVVEFYSPYFEWTVAYAREARARLDDLGIECRSTHNPAKAFEEANRAKAIELNEILGSGDIVMASPGRGVESADDWKRVAETLTAAHERFAQAGMRAGYHNHQLEWRELAGAGGGARHAMDILAAGTPEGVTLQLDVGTALEMKQDPVAWIRAHPGRVRNMHCKDWAPDKGYHVLVGEGSANWPEIIEAAETVGGVEFYLIEQEGSRYAPLETVRLCLENWKKFTS